MSGSHPLEKFIKPEFPDWTKDYYIALGRFMTEFAKVESVVALALWTLAGVDIKTARAVFSGTRMDAAIGLINRLLSVSRFPDKKREMLDRALIHAQAIAKIRNDIVHYGAPDGIAPEFAKISNKLVALTPETHLRETKITAEDLNRMSVDLAKIHTHIFSAALDYSRVTTPYVESVVRAPWLYKPQPPKTGQKQRRAKSQARPRQPKS
jgi:hypothetical protein